MLDNWTILISLEMKIDHVLRVFHEFFIEKSNKLVDVSINKEFSGNHHFPSFSKKHKLHLQLTIQVKDFTYRYCKGQCTIQS